MLLHNIGYRTYRQIYTSCADHCWVLIESFILLRRKHCSASTRVCVRAPGLKNNAEILVYCLGINASITCRNYSFCCQCYTFPHAVLFLLVHHNYTVAYDTTRTGTAALCSEQCAVTHRAVVLLVWSGEYQSPFLCSVFFSTFVLVFKCSRQRVNSTFRCSWVYLTVIGEVAFLVWIADCVSTMTSHVTSTLRIHLEEERYATSVPYTVCYRQQ